MTLPEPPVLLITDRGLARHPLQEIIDAALAGGCRWILVREKDLSSDALLGVITDAMRSARPYGARVLVSADTAAAAHSRADGVHLPQTIATRDTIDRARAMLGQSAFIGVSAHNRTEAEEAQQNGADYVTLSPIFLTESKPGYGPALGVEGLREEAARLGIPVVALGGITAENTGRCRAAGAAGIAVMGSIMRAEKPEDAMRTLIRSWQFLDKNC